MNERSGPRAEDEGFLVEPIGHVESMLTDLGSAPRQPDEGAPAATIVVHAGLRPALDGLHAGDRVVVLTWLHLGDRDALTTHPRNDPDRPRHGVFATRSPDRPNPIGLHEANIVSIDDARLVVDHLEVVDGTPVLDIKPVLDAPERR
jgi:tRNA-Thr(GGU) m(6)t(6)A37 methyltransferase TsaA